MGAARRAADERLCDVVVARLVPETIAGLEELVADDENASTVPSGPEDGRAAVGGGVSLLAELKRDPGRLGLEALLTEIAKLERVRALGLAADLLSDFAERRDPPFRPPNRCGRADRSVPAVHTFRAVAVAQSRCCLPRLGESGDGSELSGL